MANGWNDEKRDARGRPGSARGMQRPGSLYDLGDRNPSQGFTGGYGGNVARRHPDDAGGSYAASHVPRIEGPWGDDARSGDRGGLRDDRDRGGMLGALTQMHEDFSGRGPRNWRRSDARIEEEVCEMLARHPAIDASDIEVRVEQGEVTLTGEVDSRRTKRLAEEIIDHCRGVHDVHNGLRVRQDTSEPKSRSLGSYDRDRELW